MPYNDIKRGDIFYISRYETTGSEQEGGRPAIIVSNDICNKYSSTVSVVYLTTREKKEMPTHVTINSSKKVSTALCEQVQTVARENHGIHGIHHGS